MKQEDNLTLHEKLTKITYEPLAKAKSQKKFLKDLYASPAYDFDAKHQPKTKIK